MTDGWEALRGQARDVSKRQFYFGETNIPGCVSLSVCIPSLAWPVGTVWYRFVGNASIEVLYSFVIERLRRCGLRTALHEYLISSYPSVRVVLTSSGTADGGQAWLEAMGFARDKATGDWRLSVNRRRKVSD